MEKILEISKLSVGYDHEVVVSNVNFSVERGKIIVIVGESGSGKSTLLRAIGGLLPSNAVIESGQILFIPSDGGKDLTKLKKKEWQAYHGSKIGMIFQNPEKSLNPIIKIEKQFLETAKAHQKKRKQEIIEEAKLLLTKLHFDEPKRILESYPFELSGGMCQRVAIALAIMNHPAILLADEPTSALDVTSQKMTVDTLLELKEAENMAVLMVTHNIGLAFLIADEIGVMYKGKLVEWGKAEDVYKCPKHPYTKRLIEAVPKLKKE